MRVAIIGNAKILREIIGSLPQNDVTKFFVDVLNETEREMLNINNKNVKEHLDRYLAVLRLLLIYIDNKIDEVVSVDEINLYSEKVKEIINASKVRQA